MDANDKSGRKRVGGDDQISETLAAMQQQANAQGQLLLAIAQKLQGGQPVPTESGQPGPAGRRRRPRSTGPQTRAAKVAPAPAQETAVAEPMPTTAKPANRIEDLKLRIELALMSETLDDTALAKAVGQKVSVVKDLIRALRAEGKVANVGYEEHPLWTWRIGNNTDTQVLYSLIKRLISERPMPATVLVSVTGADPKRVDGVIVQLRRNEHVIDMGVSDRRRMYFLMPEEPKVIGLDKKVWKPRTRK